jgi:hypothetical protein
MYSPSIFSEAESEIKELKNLNSETHEAPKERLTSPEALRANYIALRDADENSAFNRSLVDGLKDYTSPHDDEELENKGQSDRFNITTGEGAAILSEAESGFVDIYTTPKVLAEIPLLPEVDKQQAETWSNILSEEYTTMDRDYDGSLANHLLLCDIYVKHGVAIPFFDDKESMDYSVGGLDHFKFPRKTGIITSKVEMATALGYYGITELYGKMEGEGWNQEACKKAIIQGAKVKNENWSDWEIIQREIKANEIYVETICEPIEVIHGWVREFDGKISYYIASKHGITSPDGKEEEFLFKAPNFYDNVDQAFQIFPFSVGNGGRLYTVRGLGYLVYQLCNAGDILHCKLLDNARIGSSLILQPASVEDEQDMMLIDSGPAIMIPPTMRMPERQIGINLNNSLIPAINETRNILNRATGGLAGSGLMMQDKDSRETKLEVSSKLDYINKLSSFAVTLFYGPYDKLTREKVRRAFSVRQKNPEAARRVKEMKDRCVARGVPPEIFSKIDFKRVKATRIIGTGSRSSRIMLMEQLQQGYSTWDAVGRKNFDYDRTMMLGGVELADRYAGKPNETRIPYDDSIATLENFQLLEGDYMEPKEGQLHMVHIPIHLQELEAGLKGVDEGQIDLVQWTTEHQMLYNHLIATLEITVVHETVQPELNMYKQKTQQIGEIVVNGLKMINKMARNGEFNPEAEQQGGQQEIPEDQKLMKKTEQEMKASDMKHQQKMQQEMQIGLLRLENIKQTGQAKMVAEAQRAMSGLVARDAEAMAKLQRAKSSMV